MNAPGADGGYYGSAADKDTDQEDEISPDFVPAGADKKDAY